MPFAIRRLPLIALFLAALLGASTTSSAAQDGRQVWAFYMGFWNTAASWDRQTGVLDDHPQIGNYDARDPGTVATQIGQAKGAGVDAFVVAWRGSWDTTATEALDNVLDQSAANGFHAAAVLDQFDGSDTGRTIDSLRHLMDGTIHHPAYLRYRGKPVILFAFQRNLDWRSIRAQVDPGRQTLWLAEGLRGERLYGGAMDGMYAFNFAWADGQARLYERDRTATLASGGSLFVPTIHPGWDEDKVARRDGRGNPTGRRDRAGGDFLRRAWEGATSIDTDVVLVVSWNEYMENSHIEPSTRYGTQALDTLRPLVAAWKNGSSPAAAGSAGSDPGTVAGSGVGVVDEANRRQLIQFNPGATLQQRIFGDGFVPNSGEFDVEAGGRTWRGQRAEHLRSGQVRVYYAPVDDWSDVRSANRGAVEIAGDAVGGALLARGQDEQLIEFNPGASLQQRIFADGYVPNSPEFQLAHDGAEHIAQRAEHLATGAVRVYVAPVGDVGRVGFVAGGG